MSVQYEKVNPDAMVRDPAEFVVEARGRLKLIVPNHPIDRVPQLRSHPMSYLVLGRYNSLGLDISGRDEGDKYCFRAISPTPPVYQMIGDDSCYQLHLGVSNNNTYTCPERSGS